jgi:hypothetical protein
MTALWEAPAHHPTWRERVSSDSTSLGIDGLTGLKSRGQRRCGFRLDADDPHGSGVPGGDATD